MDQPPSPPAMSMGVFLQVYNLKVDDKTHKADASVNTA